MPYEPKADNESYFTRIMQKSENLAEMLEADVLCNQPPRRTWPSRPGAAPPTATRCAMACTTPPRSPIRGVASHQHVDERVLIWEFAFFAWMPTSSTPLTTFPLVLRERDVSQSPSKPPPPVGAYDATWPVDHVVSVTDYYPHARSLGTAGPEGGSVDHFYESG
jgi:hypothetical protein